MRRISGFFQQLTPSSARLSFAILPVVLIAGLMAAGPIAQPSLYHHFADERGAFGIPHFADVTSNLAFLCVAWWGATATRRLADMALRRAWFGFFCAIALTFAGSAFYHWAPDDWGLLWDRLPIAAACAWLMCIFMGERVSRWWVRPGVLAMAAFLASLSVAAWYLGQRQGTGDLRAYLGIQLAPMLLIPAGLALFRDTGLVQARFWLGALGLYAVAKWLELHDHEILHSLVWLSGHTLKHLVAACAAGCLVVGLSSARHSEARISSPPR